MLTSTATGDVLQALLRAKPHFGPIAKTKHAKITMKGGGSFSFDYAPLDVIQGAIEAPLAAEGLLLISGLMVSPNGEQIVATRLMHARSEQWLESQFSSAGLSLDELRSVGGFVSYARRYNTLSLLDLVGEEDTDAAVVDGDGYKLRRKSETSVASGHVRRTAPVNGNGHTPAPEPDASLEHPTEGHIAALANLALTECHEDKEVYYQRIRQTMGLKPSASVAPRLLTRTMSMAQYTTVYAYYVKLAEQLARKTPEVSHGTPSTQSPASEPAPATTAEGLPVDPSAAVSSSAPEPDPADAAERDRVRLREEVAAWPLRVSQAEVEHILTHHPYSRARTLLWQARRQETAAD